MSNEDKTVAAIVSAIERNTEAIDEFRREMGFVGTWLFFILVVLMAGVGCPRAKATPILPPLGYDIGTPPAPPPNPTIQYWYTMDVPGLYGVLPVEVFAPRLVAQVASEPQGVETPEPGTGLMVTAGFLAILCFVVMGYRGVKDQKGLYRCRQALN